MKKLFNLFLSLMLALGACNSNSSRLAESEVEAPTESKLVSNEQSSNPYGNPHARLIKTADYRFEVKDMKKSTEAIELLLNKFPAYISSSSLNQDGYSLENKITLKVQSEYFEQLLKEIDLQATAVSYRNIQTTDVSKDFVDLESRLATKREVEQRYMEILRKKTGTIKEVLEAESQIAALHEEIEATVSKLNYLKAQVSYSTVNLEMYQRVSVEVLAGNDVSNSERFSKAFTAGLDGFVNFLIALAYIWPLLVIATMALTTYRFRKLIFARRVKA